MVIVKTDLGHQVMKDRSVALTPKQRSAFILFDGKRTLNEVLKATAPMGVTREEVDKMFELGLIADGAPPALAEHTPAAAPPAEEPSGRTPQERYADAYPIATKLTASLGLRGFRLNLAVEAATNYEELLQVAPKIRDAVGPQDFRPLEKALKG
ncbi:hypothetical protein GCM10027034_09080 [Ramlibacter solisilvae]|uniref:Uncharacterized protein n=1 Tax=Ramlibacter tataouinensis TaxID=94132 RepID=A0A127JXP0_9BURK|nr:hypothetical protein [Ramlibacter tataouinensis]AMO24746.1 hypothetical protein UC35_20285 [Ramlibacter tataouinensis]